MRRYLTEIRRAARARSENIDIAVQFWIGGIFGLVVFIVGMTTARLFKDTILSRAQNCLLEEAEQNKVTIDVDTRKRLVVCRPAGGMLWASSAVFVGLCVAGIAIRFPR